MARKCQRTCLFRLLFPLNGRFVLGQIGHATGILRSVVSKSAIFIFIRVMSNGDVDGFYFPMYMIISCYYLYPIWGRL